MVNLIALIGNKGSGKTTLSNQLIPHGWTTTSFATPIKNMIYSLLFDQGLPHDQIYKMLYSDLKETPTPFLNNQTTRHAMQTLGTEWRNLIDENLWLDIWTRIYSDKDKIIIDDARFVHETDRIRSLGGKIILINRLSTHTFTPDAHASEQEYKKIIPDFILQNDSTPENMLEQFNTCLKGELF